MGRPLRMMLLGGDRRSIGRVPEVLERLAASPELVNELVVALTDRDPFVRMRAADALEKAPASALPRLEQHKRALLRVARTAQQQEVRWHMAQILPRLSLGAAERRALFATLRSYLDDKSGIVRTFALQGLADLASREAAFRELTRRALQRAARDGTPAMRSRATRLLREMQPVPGRRKPREDRR